MEASKVEIQASLINLYHLHAPGLEHAFKVGILRAHQIQCATAI
jgi:hypothetical protein